MRWGELAIVTSFGVFFAGSSQAATPAECGSAAPPCDLASGGASCVDPEPTDTIFPLEAESMRKVDALVGKCRGPWAACKKDLEPQLADLGAVDQEIADLERRADALPDAAVAVCARTRPALVRSALGDVTSWCAVSRDECLGAVRDATRMLDGLPRWSECVERMEAREAQNAAFQARCAPAPAVAAPTAKLEPVPVTPAPKPVPVPVAVDPTLPIAPPAAPPTRAPEGVPSARSADQAPAPEARGVVPASRTASAPPSSTPASAPEPSLMATPEPAAAENVRARPAPASPKLIEVIATPTSVTPAPTAIYEPPAEPRVAQADVARPDETTGPVGSAVATAAPRPPESERRKGEISLSLAPFSGVMTIRDPATKAEYQPLSASVALGLDVVLELTHGLDLELGVAGRGTFASTALEQAATTPLDQLATSSGTALLVEIEPSLTLLSQYVGVGFVSDFRWDSVGVTSATTGLVTSKGDGVATGVRLVAGFGLLDHDLRFLGTLDYLFGGAADGQWRAGLRADLGACVISGTYEQYFQLVDDTAGRAVDHLQLTVGFRMPF